MAKTFKTKIRRVGASFVILIRKDIADREKIEEGDEVAVSILKARKIDDVLKLFGTAKGAGALQRDRKDKSDRY
jgi:hypothetical protein